MTISGPAPVALALFVAAAEDARRAPRGSCAGTLQTDILKEFIAQKEWVVARAPLDAPGRRPDRVLHGRDAALAPDLGVRVPHPRGGGDGRPGAGLHARRRPRLRARTSWRAGVDPDSFLPRFSFFFNFHIDFFEEVAKIRAARRLWASLMRDRVGARDPQVLAAAHPHPDLRRLAQRPAAAAEPGPHRHRGPRGGDGGHPVAAHQRLGRDAVDPDRGVGHPGAAHPADDRRRDRRGQRRPTRSAARGWWSGSPTSSRPRRGTTSRASMTLGGMVAAVEAGLPPGRDRRGLLRATSAPSRGAGA